MTRTRRELERERLDERDVNSDDNVPPAEDEWCCAICLQRRWRGAELSRMPRCGHCFHRNRVDRWFLKSGDCPYCRNPV